MAGRSTRVEVLGNRVQRVRYLLLLVSYLLLVFFAASLPAHAAGLVPDCPNGNYSLGSFLDLAQNVIKYILGISGSLALLVFIYGGFLWLTSGGEQKRIQQGMDTLTHGAIGLAIVFGSWVIVNFVVIALTKQRVGGTGAIYSQKTIPSVWDVYESKCR